VTAELRRRGIYANKKRVQRIMREAALTPRRVRRFIATTDSKHADPVFPDLAAGMVPTAADQLWLGDIIYVRLPRNFVYVAVLLDGWSRKVVGYAVSLTISGQLTLAALEAAVRSRQPTPGLIHHSDRGSQGGFKRSSQQVGCRQTEAMHRGLRPGFSS